MEAMKFRNPNLSDRLWHWKNGTQLPAIIGDRNRTGLWFARFVPQSFGLFHRLYAKVVGVDWSLCGLCFHPYPKYQHAGSVPDPTRGEGVHVDICPRCTVTRNKVLSRKGRT